MSAPRHPGPALLAFLTAMLGCLLVAGLATSGVAVGVAVASGADLAQLADDPERSITAGILGFSALFQGTLLGLASAGLALGFAEQRRERVRPVLGLDTHGWWGFSLAGAVGALTVGFLPGWIAQQIIAFAPELSGTLQLLSQRLTEGSLGGQAAIVLAVCIAAPIGEELAFRGFLWHHLEGALPGWAVWLATSLLFTAYHLDPIQSPSLIPTALFLGWLRWRSGSVVPAVVAHAVNNSLAVLALLRTSGEEPYTTPLSLALIGALATLLCCVAASKAYTRS